MNRAIALLSPFVAVLLLLAGCSPARETCFSPNIKCGDRCVDGSRDPANCGGCGVTCGAGQTCCGSCVDLTSSAFNCGACGARCPTGGSCSGSTCSCPPATPTTCGASGGNPGKCVDLDTDPVYCGTCTQACWSPLLVSTTDATCSGGACSCSSGPGVETCTGSPACRNTQTDPTACGGCGTVCPSHATCASGACACGNPAFPNRCPATGPITQCVDFATDPANCGQCGTACSGATPACCDRACVDVRSSTTNCGTCGHACAAGQACTNGTCTCPSGAVACGGTCCAGGVGCCGTGASATCMTAHSNGLGQTWFDCTPSFTAVSTTQVAASAAAQAWGATTPVDGTVFCGFPCVAAQKLGLCAIWCFGTDALGHPNANPLAGRVLQISSPACSALACPLDGTSFVTWPSP